MLKKLLALSLSTTIIIGMGTTVFATTSDTLTVPPSEINFDEHMARNLSNITLEERADAAEQGMEIIGRVSDPAEISSLVEMGYVDLIDGEVPSEITTYFIPSSDDVETQMSSPIPYSSGISVTKTKHFDGIYFDVYDKYVIPGRADFEKTYRKSGTRNWNTSITGDVEAGGTYYGVADVKASVSSTVGYNFGRSETETERVTIYVDDGETATIKVWVSYLVYEYEANVGVKVLATGNTWRPNGLIIQKTIS